MSKAFWASMTGFATAALALGLALQLERPAPVPDPQPSPQPVQLDMVRLTPTGDAVLAGRAAPDQEIEIRSGDHVLAQTVSDHRGDWVAVPNAPLSPGLHHILLPGEIRILVSVPPPEQTEPALAVMRGPDGGRRILLAPFLPSGPISLSLLVCDHGQPCQLSGQAVPRQRVHLLAQGTLIGMTTVDGQGNWSLPLAASPPNRAELEWRNEKGRVLSRLTVVLPPQPWPTARPVPAMDHGTGWWRLQDQDGIVLLFGPLR